MPSSAETATMPPPSVRAERWAATMRAHGHGALRHPFAGAGPTIAPRSPIDRLDREAAEDDALAPGATRARGAGQRAIPEAADPLRTCFERDRDRILHAAAFRRLAGKTQVFIFPGDHQRTRLTHALEVAQVATAIARACGLHEALTEAIALGHDCGHGPGGHASEDALSPYLADGFDHGPWGADVVLAPLNLCAQTLDGIRNHSWSQPTPTTPEAVVVRWADRIAYCCHDLEDAIGAGIVAPTDLPRSIASSIGATRAAQLRTFIDAMVATAAETGALALPAPLAESLAELRRFNHERIYLRPASREAARSVSSVLQALVEHAASHPGTVPCPAAQRPEPHGEAALRAAVRWVAGMTDRYACEQAVSLLGWPADELPAGFGIR